MCRYTGGSPSTAGRVLDFDIPGLEIGVAAYPEIPTGCTVFNFDVDLFPAGVMLELDVRGGAPWHSGAEDIVNAISLAGGSVYGLEVAAGVADELFAQGGYRDLVAVSGAVIYDVSVVEEPDGFRSKGIYPDKALGQEAVRALQPGRFPGEPGSRQRGLCRPVGELALCARARRAGRRLPPDRRDQSCRVHRRQCPRRDRRPPGAGGARRIGSTDRRAHDPIQDAEAILEGQSVRLQPDAAPLPGGLTRHTTLSVLVTNVAFPRNCCANWDARCTPRWPARSTISHAGRWRHPLHGLDRRNRGGGHRLHRVGSGRLQAGLGCGAVLL